jgi:simple sugar transport system ATP-binding protein
MRHGQLVAEHQTKDSTPTMLSNEMIGREVVADKLNRSGPIGDLVLIVEALCVEDSRGAAMLKDMSLRLHSGEVLGIAGVDGNGQRELSEVIAGLIAQTSGSITLDGVEISKTTPKNRYDAGIGFVPEDRHATGLVLSLSVAENLVLRSIDRPPASKNGRLDRKAISQNGATIAEQFDIRPRNAELPASALSGGNQQKIILAREIAAATRVLIVVQPTKGLDVGAIAFVQSQIVAAADRGIGVLYISTELEHVLEVADRLAVISGGQITGVLRPEDVTSERISLLMAGQKEVAA